MQTSSKLFTEFINHSIKLMNSKDLPYPMNILAVSRPIYSIKGSEDFFYDIKDVAAELTTSVFRQLECDVTTHWVDKDNVELISSIGIEKHEC